LPDGTGQITTYQPGGATATAGHPFFTSIGSNGRTCFSCHQPQDGWALKPSTVAIQFLTTQGKDPLFAPIDGADCPTASGVNSTGLNFKFIGLRSQLFSRANFRIGLGMPANPQWVTMYVDERHDPTGCENDPKYGIPSGQVSVYRRPLPSANVSFLDPGGRGPGVFNIMWDAREPNLAHQFVDATLTHAQLSCPSCAAGDFACQQACVNTSAVGK
jgi:hypothetical protein